MTFIYSFLQKRKAHENHNGIIMVVMAYVLSILMLALGSDVFYNINSSAAGFKTKDEETQQIAVEELYEVNNSYSVKNTSVQNNTYLQKDTYSVSTMSQTKLINPYNLPEAIVDDPNNTKAFNANAADETVWFLGTAMDGVTFDHLMTQLDYVITEAEIAKQAKKAESVAAKNSDKVVEDSDKTASDNIIKVTVNDTVIKITEDDIKMLERIVEAEASGEDIVGKILVANVILNRIVDEDFPDSVEKVIFQKSSGGYQFSPVANKRYWSVKISKETKKAVERALDGEDHSKGALYFIARKRTKASSAKWFDNNLKWLFKHGGHEFYKNK